MLVGSGSPGGRAIEENMEVPTIKKFALLIVCRGFDTAAGVLAAASWMAVFGATIATSRIRES